MCTELTFGSIYVQLCFTKLSHYKSRGNSIDIVSSWNCVRFNDAVLCAGKVFQFSVTVKSHPSIALELLTLRRLLS